MLKKVCSRFRQIEQDEQIEVRWMSTLDAKKCLRRNNFHADLEKSYPSPLGCIFLKKLLLLL